MNINDRGEEETLQKEVGNYGKEIAFFCTQEVRIMPLPVTLKHSDNSNELDPRDFNE